MRNDVPYGDLILQLGCYSGHERTLDFHGALGAEFLAAEAADAFALVDDCQLVGDNYCLLDWCFGLALFVI